MDYEQKYKESLRKASKIHRDDNEEIKHYMECLFPELKDEDERIRKELIKFVKVNIPDEERYIAWLEKQGTKSINIDVESMVSSYKQRLISQGAIENTPLLNLPLSAYRRGIENVLEELELKKLEKQGEKKVSYTTTVETGDGGINALVTRDIEIPFGAKDSELQEVTYFIPKGYYAKIEGDKVVIKKGEEKPATIDVDKMVEDYAKSNVRDNEEFGKPLPCMIRAYRQGLNDAINEKNYGSEKL